MKKLFVTLLFAGFISFIPSSLHLPITSTLSAQIPSDGLVAWYPFNGNANDESGNGNHGTVNGATLTADRFGNGNSAYVFNGLDQNIVAQSSFNNYSNYTLCAWVKISQSMAGGFPQHFILDINAVENGCYLNVDIDQVQAPCIDNFSGITLNNWYQIVAVKSDQSVDLYINNSLINSTANGCSRVLSNITPLFIGSTSTNTEFTNGTIDDVAIYNRALSPSEIQQLYTTTSTAVGCNLGQIASVPTSICSGESVTLNATPGQSTQSNCFAPAVKSIGNAPQGSHKVVTDVQGNYYTTGTFTGSITLGNTTLTSSGNRDAFLVKYNNCGVVQWAIKGGSTGEQDYPYSMAVDASGNVYWVGRYNQTFTINGTAGSFTAPYTSTSNGNHQDGFLVKLDSNGEVVWGASCRGTSNDGFNGIALDNSGNPIVTGGFNGCCPSSFAVTIYGPNGNVGISSFGSNYGSGLIVKFDANGNILWKGSMYNRDTGLGSIAVDNNDNIYLTTSFRSWSNGTAAQFIDANNATYSIFNPGIGLGCLIKLNANGVYQWGQSFGNVGDGVGSLTSGTDVAIDANGNPWICGFYKGNAAVFYSTNNQNLELPAAATYRGFLAQYSAAGVPLQVVGHERSTGDTYFYGLARGNGKWGVVGTFSGQTNGGLDAMLVEFNDNLTVANAENTGSSGDDSWNSVVYNGTDFVLWGGMGGAVIIANESVASASAVLWNRGGGSVVSNNNYAWSTGESNTSVTVSPTQTTTYTCTFSDGTNSCSDEVTVTVLPNVTNAISASIIEGESYTLGTQTLTTAGTYTEVFTSTNGCDSTVTLTLAVEPLLTCEISTSGNNLCAGESIELSANASFILIDSHGGAVTNQWNHTFNTEVSRQYKLVISGLYSVGTYCPQLVNDPAYQLPGFYGDSNPVIRDIGGIQDGLYCTAFAPNNFVRPTPDVYNSNHIYEYFFTAVSGSFDVGFTDCCWGDNCGSVTFELYELANNFTALWSTNATTPNITVSPTQTTTYTATVTTATQTCTDSITITVNPLLNWYADADADGFGENLTTVEGCDQPAGFVPNNTDCNDADATVFPNAEEICFDGMDNNCDGVVDENCAIFGCTNPEACNFNSNANAEDGSCILPQPYFNCAGNCINDSDGDGVCDEIEIAGCTDATAFNYNPQATNEDGSCEAVLNCDVTAPVTEICEGEVVEMVLSVNNGLIESSPASIVGFNWVGNTAGLDFYVSDANDSWLNNRNKCINSGGILAVITNAIQNNQINQMLGNYFNGLNLTNWSVHIGLTDEQSEGSWINSLGQIQTYFNWNSGEPSNSYGGAGEDYGQMYSSGFWNDCRSNTGPDAFRALLMIPSSSVSNQINWSTNATTPTITVSPTQTTTYTATVTTATQTCTDSITITVNPLLTWYADADADGFGNPDDVVQDCNQPQGYITDNTDCNDEDAATYPGAAEICDNNRDENCDGVDSLCFVAILGCTDVNACNFNPDANTEDGSCILPQPETCNGLDDNCNGQIDEGLSAAAINAVSATTALYPVCSGNSIRSANLNNGANSAVIEGSGNDLWYSFTALYNTFRAGLSAASGDNDVRLYTMTPGGCLELIETEHETTNGNQTLLSDQLIVGQTYYVAVHNISGPMNASAKICFNHLTGSSCDHYYSNNTGIYSSVCNSFKAQYRANAVAYTFDILSATQNNVNQNITPWSYTTTSASTVVARLGALLPANQGTAPVVYTLKVPVLYSLFDAAGNFENLFAQATTTCTVTLNAETTIALRSSDRCPMNKPITGNIAPDRTVCGAMRYDWEFTEVLPNPGTAQVVQGGAYASVFFLSNIPGITVGKTYNVRVRPVHSSGTVGQWGSVQCLRMGAAGMMNHPGSADAEPPLLPNHRDAYAAEGEMDALYAIYPNPTSTGSFVLQYNEQETGNEETSDEERRELVMMDITGKVVFKTNVVLNGNIAEIHFGDLDSGLYLVDFGGERSRLQVVR